MSKTIEILKFLRVSPEKKRLIQVRGKLFSTVDDIADERVQHVVRQSIAEMVEMAGGVDRLVEGGYLKTADVPLAEFLSEAAPETPKAPEKIEPVAKEAVEVKPTIEPQISELKNEVTDMGQPLPPTLLPKTEVSSDLLENQSDSNNGSLLNRFRSLTGRKPEKPKSIVPKLDIAGQINEILQRMIEIDRSYVGRQVELRSAINGDLLFIVDGRSYDSVNDIQDESVANLFRAAIAEWEN
ncbi:MAG: hypothetical protein AB8G95_09745 [Anaerolineae bacterium]